MRIPGRWRDGFALDFHTLSSTHLGYDEFGHAIFDTKRSELGELLYQLKYQSNQSTIPEIVEAAAGFRSEERRVGKECRCRWSRYHASKKNTKTCGRCQNNRTTT